MAAERRCPRKTAWPGGRSRGRLAGTVRQSHSRRERKMGEGGQGLRRQGRLIRPQESALYRFRRCAINAVSTFKIRRPRESGDPAAFVKRHWISSPLSRELKAAGMTILELAGSTLPRPPCEPKPRGNERDTAQRRHRPEPARSRQREPVKAARKEQQPCDQQPRDPL